MENGAHVCVYGNIGGGECSWEACFNGAPSANFNRKNLLVPCQMEQHPFSITQYYGDDASNSSKKS